jgi:hypothetical protein
MKPEHLIPAANQLRLAFRKSRHSPGHVDLRAGRRAPRQA